jgi:ATP-binding cassette subfamily F protein 3
MLNPQESAYDHVRDLMPDASEAQRRARLAGFGLGRDNAETPAGDLSGGEKARLLFSLISFNAPHMLVLDEPANHLDMDSRAELIKSLNAYTGAIIVISHDRNLLESVVDRLWLVDGGMVETYEGTLDDYRQSQLDTKKNRKKKASKESETSKAEQRKAAAEAREAIAPLKKRTEDLERKTSRLRDELGLIESQLSAPGFFNKNRNEATRLTQSQGQIKKKIARLEDEWLTASDAYETAKAAL